MTKIFPARAYIDYGTEYEERYLKLLRETYPGAEIMKLPNLEELHKDKSARFGVGLFEKEEEHFFPLIDDCDIFTAAVIDNELDNNKYRRHDKGELSEGAKDEMLYALSIGKKVYKVTNNEFEEIHSISDSEELIKQIVVLDKQYKVLKQLPKMKNLIKTEKRLNAHPRVVDFIFRNKKVMDIMRGFLSSDDDHKDSVRPIAIQYRYPFIEKLKYAVRYVPNNMLRKSVIGGSQSTLMTINDMTKDMLMRREGELHFYECFFNKTVINGKLLDSEIKRKMEEIIVEGGDSADFKPWMVLDNRITGIGIVFDIDMPSGANIFDKKWWSEAMALKDGVVEYIHDILDLKCICSTTGNGLNISCEPYWFDDRDDNFFDFRDMIEDNVKDLNELYRSVLRRRLGGKGVAIDKSAITWSIYKKMFFSYKAKQHKITIPISKKEDDREWVERISDIDNFLEYEKINVDEIIKRSNIEKDKWW